MLKVLPSLLIFALLFGSLNANTSIEQKIKHNKNRLQNSKNNARLTNLKLKILVKQIKVESRQLAKLESDIKSLNRTINNKQSELSDAKGNLKHLQNNSKKILKEKKMSEEEIINTIIDNFSSSVGLNFGQDSSEKAIIDSQIYHLLLNNSKDNIIRLNSNYMQLSQNQSDSQAHISKIKKYIAKREAEKLKLRHLMKMQKRIVYSFRQKHRAYQNQLKKTLKKQDSLSNLLGKLKILKKAKEDKRRRIEKEREERIKALLMQKNAQKQDSSSLKNMQNHFAKNINFDVRMLGSSITGIRVANYRGKKTIPPLRHFTITKKFGKYFDPVYKIKLFNDSIILKPSSSKAKVYAVLSGKIVYAKKNTSMFDNIVIIEHAHGLHTIYSHLDEISPHLKVGRWVPKGYVVGRVDDVLNFQVIKNNDYINPKELFSK